MSGRRYKHCTGSVVLPFSPTAARWPQVFKQIEQAKAVIANTRKPAPAGAEKQAIVRRACMEPEKGDAVTWVHYIKYQAPFIASLT